MQTTATTFRRKLPALFVSTTAVGILLAGGAGTANATPSNKLCTGTWKHKVSTVTFQRGRGGTLAWSFKLSHTTRSALGSPVTVGMPYAYVNGKAINPPYHAHTEPSWYNFHGSINKYQRVGSSKKGSIKTGDKLTFYWTLEGSNPRTVTDRYITYKVPKPGSH